MRQTLSLIILTAAAIVFAWPVNAEPAALPSLARVLDTLRADYLEDEQSGRRIAALRMGLMASGDGAILHLQVAATGRRVDPVPSFRGVYGANHITARDLTELTETDQLKIYAMARDGTGKRFGTITPGTRNRIPERRLLPSGVLQLDAVSAASYLLSVDCESPRLTAGVHRVYLEVKGIPRLRIDVRVGASQGGGIDGAILDVTCIGGHAVRSSR